MTLRANSLFSVCLAAALISAPAAASAQSPQVRRRSDTIARRLAALARTPASISLLIASGRAALQLGDADAAAGFFGRARELAPRSASAHLGMASTLVALNQLDAAFVEFARARDLGASPSAIAPNLGLAYDLAGDQLKAQAVYRSGLDGRDAAEARRRLALSLAIAGNAAEAATVLRPLLAVGDRPARLTRAFILALGGDVSGSAAALDEISRGSGSAAEPFLRALPGLSSGEKAATLNLGIFPTRVAIPDAGSSSSEIASTDAPGGAVEPMEYGGPLKHSSPSTVDQAGKATLALYGVFAGP